MASFSGGETFEPIGCFREDRRVEAHPHKVVAERAGVHAVVEALDPSAGVLIVIDLMLGSAAFFLCFPVTEEIPFVKDVSVVFRPFTECLATGAVNGTETGQLPELLRELRDFR